MRQHFLPKDAHTLERKNAYVTTMVDKGKFSTPFEIARMRMEDPTPEQVAAYEPLIDQLNGRTVSAALRATFDANGFPLPPKPRVDVKSVNSQWTITDRSFPHDNGTVIIRYDVYESVEFDDRNRQVAVLRAGASIDDKPSARESIPIQLFLNEEQNDTFRGKVLRLAGYVDEPLEPTDKARFDAVLAALEQGTLAVGTVDIEADLENEAKVDLAPGTKPVKVSATGPADAQRITWSVSDGKHRYKIMVEHRSNPDGVPAHTITVYADYADDRAPDPRGVPVGRLHRDGPGQPGHGTRRVARSTLPRGSARRARAPPIAVQAHPRVLPPARPSGPRPQEGVPSVDDRQRADRHELRAGDRPLQPALRVRSTRTTRRSRTPSSSAPSGPR